MNALKESKPAKEIVPATDGDVFIPKVQLVLVTHDPGEWFEEVLQGIAAQDYKSLDVTVVDTTRRAAIEEKVKSILPNSEILHVKRAPGFSALTPQNLQSSEKHLFYFRFESSRRGKYRVSSRHRCFSGSLWHHRSSSSNK